MNRNWIKILSAALVSTCISTSGLAADALKLKAISDAAIRPIMDKYGIPGMAVAIAVDGQNHIFNYGVESKDTNRPVSPATMFELGSISKTFTVTLTSYADVTGRLSLSDKASKYLPAMKGRPFGDVVLTDLGTHTAGGFPLQVPDEVKTEKQLMEYLATWKPSYAAGTHRTYANPSIGMLGYITAKSMNDGFVALMEGKLFPSLGLKSTFIDVPKSRMADYAQGYKRNGEPARMTPAILSSEAYGVKSTASDMIRFIDANMGLVELGDKLQQAINNTHRGYFDVGAMTQDLIWEQYSYPATLTTLLDNNSSAMLKTIPVKQLTPAMEPREDVWINKTGSTNGFGAYVAFIPKERLGIVILANKNYPNEDRVSAAYRILTDITSAR
ncbi:MULTISPECIES: class C beta-lactamase [Rhizobium]|uniref:Beta-lactamase n=1 Tax=Rhizobium leguminosarum bv. trifolii (strain WSM1325) TaxID=395491 RepID=C6B407_RHILS|nr:class C beta-lactamase [Rhizobium leguminosarum]ACS56958.1 Beta-lactamase [Rhizobium leguminosarum bv. trifolii WSM1325]MBY2912081.1 beta-lactamase [Rhizobium leguminosarum]MBY2952015.1 beta-lactamase [Rhizobium leguminosarum]RWY65478.1 class C beta-lactamase [Rhizobium leguminosarum]